jgi:hypothetical protein
LGPGEKFGRALGLALGPALGLVLGPALGFAIGDAVGKALGLVVGNEVGSALLGFDVGAPLGDELEKPRRPLLSIGHCEHHSSCPIEHPPQETFPDRSFEQTPQV